LLKNRLQANLLLAFGEWYKITLVNMMLREEAGEEEEEGALYDD